MNTDQKRYYNSRYWVLYYRLKLSKLIWWPALRLNFIVQIDFPEQIGVRETATKSSAIHSKWSIKLFTLFVNDVMIAEV